MKELIIIYLLIGIILRVVNLVGYIIYYGRTPYNIIQTVKELVLYVCGGVVIGVILWPYSMYLTYRAFTCLDKHGVDCYSGDMETDLDNLVAAVIVSKEEES